MGTFSIWHWLIVLAIALLLFGSGGKIKRLLGDLGSGVTAFRKGLREGKPLSVSDDEQAAENATDGKDSVRKGGD